MTSSEIRRLLRPFMKGAQEKDHAKLSASGSERWLGCPASISLSKGRKQIEHPSAQVGTNAHTLYEFIMKNSRVWRAILKHQASEKFKQHIKFSKEQLQAVLVMVVFVESEIQRLKRISGKLPEVYIERKVHLEGVGFGTTDTMLWQMYGDLHVVDYKNGKYKVSPVDNTQGLYYGVAAADEIGWDFARAAITIVQPNAPGKDVKTWDNITPGRFEKAKLMFQRGAERTRAKNPAIVPNNKYCWFCPAKPICPAHADVRRTKLMSRFERNE